MTQRRVLAIGLIVLTVFVVAHTTLGSTTAARHAVATRASAPRTDPESRRGRALAAALAYVRAAPELAVRGPIGRSELLGEVVTPKLLARQVAEVDLDVAAIESRLQGRDGETVPLSRLRWVETPLTATSEVGSASVKVRVWSVGVLGAPTLDGVRSVWRTFTLEVVATGGRWLVDAVRVEPGPAPIEAGVAMAPSAFADFERVASWPPAVGRTG